MARPAIPISSTWLVLLAQLSDDATARMRILRKLDAMGCAVLRDGAFILPDTQAGHQGLERLGQHISASGGSHHLLHVTSDAAQAEDFARLFDRSMRYVEVIKTLEGMLSGMRMADPTAMSRMLIKLKRDFEKIGALDFFPSPTRERAARALADTEAEIRRILFPPDRAVPTSGQLRSRQKFFRRSWVTMKPLWVDRLASAWLIRRFIDAEASVGWIERHQTPRDDAVSFGFAGALFCNSASQVTYEVLLDGFGLSGNAALKRIAGIVHAVDIGGAPVPEAAGVESLLLGAQRRAPTEAALLAETEKTFDLLYDAYFQAPSEAAAGGRGS